jgi:dTDP-4-dehydrorhamnose reductase
MIVVTGSNGQLGNALKQVQPKNKQVLYTDRTTLDITQPKSIQNFVVEHSDIEYIINAAAYTSVDLAEEEEAQAHLVNSIGVMNLAQYIPEHIKILHVSTDYVFDGNHTDPYIPSDVTNPINAYGRTKLAGEKLLMYYRPDSLIVRTSWVYSKGSKNFVTTMERLMKERDQISVVDDQFGLPTNAHDLAKVLFKMTQFSENSGIYHFSNTGEPISWYQFAQEIKETLGLECEVKSTPASGYPTKATRPQFSALGQSQIHNIYEDFDIEPKPWKQSLQEEFNS